MRLKTINIEERSSLYSAEQKDRLKTISSEVNKIGDIFDVIVDFETYVINKIYVPLNDFMTVRTNKDEIIAKNGEDTYLNVYFKPAAEKLRIELGKISVEWDTSIIESGKSEYTVENMKKIIDKYKELYRFLSPITTEIKIDGFEALKNIINEFTNFRIYKIVTTKNIVDQLQDLIELKSKIEGKEVKNKKLTIEDL